jgi:hypothetical protein
MAEALYFLEEGGISLCMVTNLIQQTFDSLCWPLILFDFQATNTLSKQCWYHIHAGSLKTNFPIQG